MDPNRLEQLAQVASWYYEENLSLNTIAKRLDRSVSMISRMLQEARDQNLVEIRIRYPVQTNSKLESQICETFSLDEAHVLSNPKHDDSSLTARRLGNLGARVVQQQLTDGMSIGISWGSSIYAIVSALPYLRLPDSTVIQVSGAVGATDPTVDGAQMAHWLAQKLDSTSRFLHTPLIVKSDIIAQALKEDKSIAETLDLARRVDLALVGVGSPYMPNAGLIRAGYLSQDDIMQLKKNSAVGDISGFHLDKKGVALDIPINNRIVGISPEDLRAIPNVIVAAQGSKKAPALLASLKGAYINTLVTDAETAKLVLAGA